MPRFNWAPTEGANLSSAINQAVGAASMCWDFPNEAGNFNSDLAASIAEGLEKWLKEKAFVQVEVGK